MVRPTGTCGTRSRTSTTHSFSLRKADQESTLRTGVDTIKQGWTGESPIETNCRRNIGVEHGEITTGLRICPPTDIRIR